MLDVESQMILRIHTPLPTAPVSAHRRFSADVLPRHPGAGGTMERDGGVGMRFRAEVSDGDGQHPPCVSELPLFPCDQ